MEIIAKIIITKDYLQENPNHIFVFGDNTLRRGYGGAAALRDLINTYGFITKKYPNNKISSFYTPYKYKYIYKREINFLREHIRRNQDRMYLISKLGAGLANKFLIFEKIINVKIKYDLKEFNNVKFLW